MVAPRPFVGTNPRCPRKAPQVGASGNSRSVLQDLVFESEVMVWLRQHGCFGLVFPSARRNARVRCENQQAISCRDGRFEITNVPEGP